MGSWRRWTLCQLLNVMETWVRKRMSEKQAEQFDRECSVTFAVAGGSAVSTEWGETPEAVAAQDALGASTPTYGFID